MRTRMMTQLVGGLGLALVAVLPASAQLANPSPAALGMGDNYTAAARGYSAVAWNPAGLALTGNPDFSLNITAIRGIAGIDPVTLADFKDYEGKVVPPGVKAEWLQKIEEEGGEAGNSGFDVNGIALQVGRFGLQYSASGRAYANLSPGIAELFMFGNVDESGNPQSISLSGSAMDMAAYSSLGASYAHPLMVTETSRLALGVTGKYIIGHFMMMGAESQGSTNANPLSVSMRFPIVHTPIEEEEGGFETNNGSGMGLDIGVGYESGNWTFAAAVQNVINTFEWDETLLRYREGTILFDEDTTLTEFDSESFTSANVPAALRDAVTDMKFKPVIALGAAGQVMPKLKVAADLRLGSDKGIRVGPKLHVGAGAEYKLLSFLPIRVGAGYVQLDSENSGLQFSGGLGLNLGPLNLSAALAQRSTDAGKDTMFMVSVLSFGM